MSGKKGIKFTKEHRENIAKALRGKKKSKEWCLALGRMTKERLKDPTNHPNYRGDKVGYAGIHRWLRKNFGLAQKCEKCGVEGKYKNNKWTIAWCLRKGCEYKRNKKVFIPLCNKCHRNYDKNEGWNNNISKGKKGKPRNKLI